MHSESLLCFERVVLSDYPGNGAGIDPEVPLLQLPDHIGLLGSSASVDLNLKSTSVSQQRRQGFGDLAGSLFWRGPEHSIVRLRSLQHPWHGLRCGLLRPPLFPRAPSEDESVRASTSISTVGSSLGAGGTELGSPLRALTDALPIGASSVPTTSAFLASSAFAASRFALARISPLVRLRVPSGLTRARWNSQGMFRGRRR